MDAWNLIGSGASVFMGQDLNYSKILAAKKALQLLNDNSDVLIQLCLAASDGDNLLVKSIASQHTETINKPDKQGLTPLIYAVCFDKKECVQILLNLHADPNIPDNIVGWTPLMWATYLGYESLVTELISNAADPYLKSSKTKQCAVDLALPGTPMFTYYSSHNLIKKNDEKSQGNNLFYKEDLSAPIDDSNDFDTQLRLQTTGLAGLQVDNAYTNSNPLYKSSKFIEDSNDNDDYITNEEFNFNALLPKQYIKFVDSTISPVIEYVFTLREKYHTKPIYAAAIVYQTMRYASAKLQSTEMSTTILELFLTRVRSVTDTKSGVVQLAESNKVDIMKTGYWISCLNHLYYFLYRDGACRFFENYPSMLQELVLCLQSLMTQFSFALDSKLEHLIDDCILNYDSVPDLNVVYKTDWKLFQKKTTPKSSYEEILNMLYPPSVKDQMKPSPIKVIQTLGAMVYVMELYNINEVIKQQCFSSILSWLGASLFNRILANKKYNSRTKAMQIRLNLSTIEDWLRVNNFTPYKTTDSAFSLYSFPESIVKGQITLKGVARFEEDEKVANPFSSAFYYGSLVSIGKYHLLPVIELLQWLQVSTSLDLESLQATLSSFTTLNSNQLLKTIKNYKHEVDEEKVNKESKKYLKTHDYHPSTRKIIYSDDSNLFLSISTVYPVTLPCLVELFHQYGADIDTKYDAHRALRYQPHLPLEIVDDIDNIYDQHIDDYDRDLKEDIEEDEEEYDYNGNGSSTVDEKSSKHGTSNFRGTELFQELSMPTSVARKTWNNEEESNPWA